MNCKSDFIDSSSAAESFSSHGFDKSFNIFALKTSNRDPRTESRASIVAERSEARKPSGKRFSDLNSVGPKTPN